MIYTARVLFISLRYLLLSRVALMVVGFACFIVGIGLSAANIYLSGFVWPVVAVVCIILCWRRLALLALPCAIAAGLLLGIWRGSEVLSSAQSYKTYIGQKVNMVGNVADDATYNDKNQLVFVLESVSIGGKQLPGSVRVTTIQAIKPSRGDVIEVSGKMYSGFSKYQATFYYANVKIVEQTANPILQLRRIFAANVQSIMPSEQAALGLGFLLGVKSQINDDLNDQLKVLGLTHIVVASGYNLTVLVRLARRIFAKISHFQMTLASLLLIAGFVGVTGLSASMSRAALVASLSVLAWYYGRRIHPLLLILLAAAVTGAINPFYVWGDIGWWLSFLAFAGVLLLAPLLQSRIFGKKQPKLIGQIILETISAQIVTLPLLVYVFGSLSVWSLLANVLVVPLIPLAMLFTFLAGVLGQVLPYIAWPAIWLIGSICNVVRLLASAKWAAISLNISLLVFVLLYCFIVLTCFVLWWKTKHDYLSRSVIE